ncbi:MAG: type II secretion system F family protein [Candidatus Riflebacteria bacterium]|nr:type II secretion system F family protein [Candidatus Riflebacteria bacterium]
MLKLLFLTAIVYAGVYAILNLMGSEDKDVRDRLGKLDSITASGEEKSTEMFNEDLQKPFSERVLMPVVRSVSKVLTKSTSSDFVGQLQKQLAQAGYPGELKPQEFFAIQVIVFMICLMVGIGVCAMWVRGNFMLALQIIGGSAIFGILLPRLWLTRRIKDRQHDVQLQLPDIMDLLTVSVEAGLGFDAGLGKVIEKLKGPLPDEFRVILREIRVGKTRKQALKDSMDRIGVTDVEAFFSAVIQAEQLGVSLAKVLRVQSDQLRQKRRQRAEEQAQKAPVKMMFPLVLFIFPVILIVLLGPAVIRAYDIFVEQGQGPGGK